MSNNYVNNKNHWDDLSDIDYLSAFINSWLAFNAWYRSYYNLEQDRQIIDQIKESPNPIRNRVTSMLKVKSSDDAKRYKPDQETLELRADVALLYDRLENIRLIPFNKKAGNYKDITLTNVFIKKRTPTKQITSYGGITYEVDFNKSGTQIIINVVVKNSKNVVKYTTTHQKYAPELLVNENDFKNSLTPQQQNRLLLVYKDVNPDYIVDLTSNSNHIIECGAYEFKCTSDDLFAGIIEVIYLMRCMLFHGELVPTKSAAQCYEPAYRIIKRFLKYA